MVSTADLLKYVISWKFYVEHVRRAISAKKNTALQILNMFDLFQPSCHNNVKQGHSPFPNDNFSCMDPVKREPKKYAIRTWM